MCKETSIKDVFENKEKMDVYMNITDEDKKKLTNLNSFALRSMELSILERTVKKNIRVQLGEVWLVDLGENVGTEINNIRPCIIVSLSYSNVVTVIPVTNNYTDFIWQCPVNELIIDGDLTGVAKPEQIKSVSKARLGKKIGRVSNMERLQESLLYYFCFDSSFISIFKDFNEKDKEENIIEETKKEIVKDDNKKDEKEESKIDNEDKVIDREELENSLTNLDFDKLDNESLILFKEIILNPKFKKEILSLLNTEV